MDSEAAIRNRELAASARREKAAKAIAERIGIESNKLIFVEEILRSGSIISPEEIAEREAKGQLLYTNGEYSHVFFERVP